CKNPGRGQVIAERVPRGGLHAGLLFELAARRVERRLAIVDLAARQFPDPTAGDVTELAQQADTLVLVDRNDGRAARMLDDLQLRDRPVRQLYALDVQLDDAAGEDMFDLGHFSCRPCLRQSPGRTNADTGATTTCRLRGSVP